MLQHSVYLTDAYSAFDNERSLMLIGRYEAQVVTASDLQMP